MAVFNQTNVGRIEGKVNAILHRLLDCASALETPLGTCAIRVSVTLMSPPRSPLPLQPCSTGSRSS